MFFDSHRYIYLAILTDRKESSATGVPLPQDLQQYSLVMIYVAKDALAYSLNYYNDGTTQDYDAISSDPFMSLESSAVQGASSSLYNGNIRHMTIDNKKLEGGPMAYTYKYDQLHRIKDMQSYNNADLAAYAWGATAPEKSDYSMGTSYDGNGNILAMLRTGIKEGQPAPSEVSNIDYEYKPGTNLLMGTMELIMANKPVDGSATVNFWAGEEICLNPGFEVEAVDPGTFVAEIKQCETKVIESDYVYDGTGNLINNESGADIRWSPYGKVLDVTSEDETQIVSFGDRAQGRHPKCLTSEVRRSTNPASRFFEGEEWMRSQDAPKESTCGEMPLKTELKSE